MAYMSQEKKSKLVPEIKRILSQYKLNGSLSVRNHSTLVLTIKSGRLDFIDNLIKSGTFTKEVVDSLRRQKAWQVNEYHISNQFSDACAKALLELKAAMNVGNHDNSDIQSDYFDVGWYVNINIGGLNKPYVYTGS